VGVNELRFMFSAAKDLTFCAIGAVGDAFMTRAPNSDASPSIVNDLARA
jgi:hypothetical protein